MNWHTLASAPPPPGATTITQAMDYALAFKGSEYAKDVLKVDPFDYYDRHCKVMDLEKASIEDLRFYLFMFQRDIRWAEFGGEWEEGRREFMQLFDIIGVRLGAWPSKKGQEGDK